MLKTILILLTFVILGGGPGNKDMVEVAEGFSHGAPCSVVEDPRNPAGDLLSPHPRLSTFFYQREHIQTAIMTSPDCFTIGQNLSIKIARFPGYGTRDMLFKGFTCQVRKGPKTGQSVERAGKFDINSCSNGDCRHHCDELGAITHFDASWKLSITVNWTSGLDATYDYIDIIGAVMFSTTTWFNLRHVTIPECPPPVRLPTLAPKTTTATNSTPGITTQSTTKALTTTSAKPTTTTPTTTVTTAPFCPEGYSPMAGVGGREGKRMCYLDGKQQGTFEEARQFCNESGASMVTIKNEAEYGYLVKAKVISSRVKVWVGFKYTGNPRNTTWFDGGLVNDMIELISSIEWAIRKTGLCGSMTDNSVYRDDCSLTEINIVCQLECAEAKVCGIF